MEEEKLFSGSTGLLFVTVSAGWMMIQMGRQLLPPLLPNIIESLAITSFQAGIGISLMWGIYALFQYPSGRLSDELSRKTLLVGGLLVTTLGFVVMLFSSTYLIFLVAVCIIGLGSGLYPTAARAFLSDVFTQRRGQAFGIHTASGDIGNAASAGVAVAVLAVATWKTAFLPLALLLFVVVVVLHYKSDETYVFSKVELGITETAYRLFYHSHLRRLIFVYMLYAITWQSVTAFLPTYLQIAKEFSVALASAGFGAVFVVGAVTKPVSGYLGDWFGRAKVAIGLLVVAVLGLVVIIYAGDTWLIFVGIGVFAIGLLGFPPVMQAYLMTVFPTKSMGGDLGGMRTLYVGVGAIGPAFIGYSAGVYGYTWSFTWLVLGLLIAIGIFATTYWHHSIQT